MATVKKIDLNAMLAKRPMYQPTRHELSQVMECGTSVEDMVIDFPLKLDAITYGELDLIAVALEQPVLELGVLAIQLGIVKLNEIIKQEAGLEEANP